jgi:cytochrome c553
MFMTIQKNLKWLVAMLLMLITSIAHAVSASPESFAMVVGKNATVKVSEIKGTASLINSNTGVVSAKLSISGTYGSIQVTALSAGSTALTVKDSSGSKSVKVTVKLPMTLSPASLSLAVKQTATISMSNATGEIRLTNSNSEVASASLSDGVIKLEGKTVGTTTITVKDNITTFPVPVTVISETGPNVIGNTDGRLLASNCFQCHGTNGSGGFDSLLGDGDIYGELIEYLNGAEDPDGIMAAHVKGYTQEQLQSIADYLANP